MKKNKNSIFKRILSALLGFAMLFICIGAAIPAMETPAKAVEGATDAPEVSLAWADDVVVSNGVALPYKSASSTASSHTMKFKVKASGTIVGQITARVQSFSLSAEEGKEYATVDVTFTLTAEKPTAEGTVTVYANDGYATKSGSTVYTNEFGLRITELTNSKRKSGADTLRSQVLVANGYTLDVSKNSSGANYGGGTGTFPNGYVYTALTKEYTKKFIDSEKVKPDNDYAAVKFNPYAHLMSQSNDMPKLLSLYPDMKVYFNGTGKIEEISVNKTRYGFFIRITENGKNLFDQHQHAKKKWDDWSFNWLTYGYANDHPGDHPNSNGDFGVVDTSVAAYHRTSSYGDRYLVQSGTGNLTMTLNTCNSDLNTSGKEYYDFYFSAMAANNTLPVVQSFFVEDRVYGAGETMYMVARFNKPVQFENNPEHPLKIQAKIGNSTSNYFTYCGGNMTDTLIFSMVLPEDKELNGNFIELVGFDNEDYNKNLCDLFWNTSNKNNAWTVSDDKVSGKRLVCSMDTRTPDISITNLSGDTGIAKNASFTLTVRNITALGKIDVAWTKTEAPPLSADAWSNVTFTANADDVTTVSVEKKGLTGVYYAHVRAMSVSGSVAIKTCGPFSLDNQPPTLGGGKTSAGDDAQAYLKQHTLSFDISDDSSGVDSVYMIVRREDGSLGLAGQAAELLVYKKSVLGNLLSIAGGVAEITVESELLNLPADSYGGYKISFYAVDALGNRSEEYAIPDMLMFDNRNTFTVSCNAQAAQGVSIKGNQIYYNGASNMLIFSHAEVGVHSWGISSLKFNGVDATNSLADYGIHVENGDEITLTFDESTQGYIELVFLLNGERYSNVLNFYVTAKNAEPDNYVRLYAPDRLLINEVWQLSTATFYTGDNRNGNYYVGSNVKPIFSSKEKALEYAKFYEKQDIVIEHIDNEVEKNNLEGGWQSNYLKSDSDRDRVVEVGQTWLRYKSESWTVGSNNEEQWVYYFYSNEKVNSVNPDLTPALNRAIERNAKLICGYDGDNRIYLTANNTSKNYVNNYGEPYYEPRGILTETLSYRGIFAYEITCSADEGIYDSFITYDQKSVPLVSNYQFKLSDEQRGFAYYRQYGATEWSLLQNGESLKSKLKASGLYEISEFCNGYATYLVFVDLDAPVISYTLKVDGSQKTGYITSDTSGGTLRASEFTVNALVNDIQGSLATERDRWAYFYVLYNSLGGGEHAFLTMEDLNAKTYSLQTGIYKIYACDRLGNTVVQTIKINTEDVVVRSTVNSSGLTVSVNRVPSDIAVGSFKVWRDNMLLDVPYAQNITFTQSGVYRIAFEDVYGNFYENEFSFRRELPTVNFYREKKEGAGIYEQISVNGTADKLSNVFTEDNQLFTVSTSASIRISYPLSVGYDFEFVGNAPKYKTSVISMTNIDIQSSSENWTLKVFYKNDPDVYVLITCVVDKEAPAISGMVTAKEYEYNEQFGAEDNVLFAATGNTASGFFYDGGRAVGDSAVIEWTDETKVSLVGYSYNGGEWISLNPELGQLTVTKNGRYVFEAEDVFGNKSTFEFTLTNHIDFGLTVDGDSQEIEYDCEQYVQGNEYKQTLYTGREATLLLRENALVALYGTDGENGCIYNLAYKVQGGSATLTVSARDGESEEFEVVENGEIVLTKSGSVLRGIALMDYTYQNGVLTLILPECEREYELYQIRVSDETGHCPVIVQIERSNTLANFTLSREDGTELNLNQSGFLGSNQALSLDSVSDDVIEIAAYYSAVYTETFAGAEKILLYGAGSVQTLEKEGYYKLVAINRYGNERVVLIAISFQLRLDVSIGYEEMSSRRETLNASDEYSVYSNKSVEIAVWDIRATVVCEKDGEPFTASVSEKNGYLTVVFDEIGEYVLTVSDGCENDYVLTVFIEAPETIAYNGFLTGFNENALKKAQNYTNGAVSVAVEKLEDNGIKYVAFRKVGAKEFTVLYDEMSISATAARVTEIVGKVGEEDGEYEVWFSDIYGNVHIETVKISTEPMLTITRQTQDEAKPSDYDFGFALEKGAWSNYTLNFINRSDEYSLTVDGEKVQFTDSRYAFTLPSGLGAAAQDYVLKYVDDYGNSYTINVHLYRKVPESSIVEGAETVASKGTLYAKTDFAMSWGERITAAYTLDGGVKTPFDKDMVFTKDGKYVLTFTDYAGNASTRIIVKDSTVLYDIASDGIALPNGAAVSSKVSLAFGEEVSYTVTKDGEEYDSSARSFTADGQYVITLTDYLGNETSFEFTIYAKARQNFTYSAADGYTISQIWYIMDGHRVSLVGDVTLDENGAQSYAFSVDGSYEFELLHTDSEQMCYFTMRIDNTPPEAVLVGVEDGGVTRENVTIEQLKNGDMIYVYKEGAGWKTYFVDGESETVLDLLGNSDFGSYSVVIEDEAGNVVRYEFVKEFATNTYSNVFICLLLIAFGAIGIIYIRFNGKVRTK